MENDGLSENEISFVVNDTRESHCRICYDQGTRTKPLIRPCRCQSLIHYECLEHWRYSNISNPRISRCEVCHYEYRTARNPLRTFMCSRLYERALHHMYIGSHISNAFKLILFHGMFILVLSGMFYGIDYTRYIGSHIPMCCGEPYRIYYDLSFTFYVTIAYLINMGELVKLDWHQWSIYLRYIFLSCSSIHICIYLHIACCIIIGAYMWKTVAFDVLLSIPLFHFTCILHHDARKKVEESIQVGRVLEYSQPNSI
jgi:hypothetical protein